MSVILLRVILLKVILLSDILLSDILLSVILKSTPPQVFILLSAICSALGHSEEWGGAKIYLVQKSHEYLWFKGVDSAVIQSFKRAHFKNFLLKFRNFEIARFRSNNFPSVKTPL
jgi:hypothetical protein